MKRTKRQLWELVKDTALVMLGITVFILIIVAAITISKVIIALSINLFVCFVVFFLIKLIREEVSSHKRKK